MIIVKYFSDFWNVKIFHFSDSVRHVFKTFHNSNKKIKTKNIPLTLDWERYLLKTKWAARLCTFSILMISACLYGSQTVGAYYSIGLTQALKAFSFIEWELICWGFSTGKPRVLLAFLQNIFMCLCQFSSDVKIHEVLCISNFSV